MHLRGRLDERRLRAAFGGDLPRRVPAPPGLRAAADLMRVCDELFAGILAAPPLSAMDAVLVRLAPDEHVLVVATAVDGTPGGPGHAVPVALPDLDEGRLLVAVHTLLARHGGAWDGVLDLPAHLTVAQALRLLPAPGTAGSRVLVETTDEGPVPDLRVPAEPVFVSVRTTGHDLEVRLVRRADGSVAGELVAAAARYSAEEAAALAARLAVLCHGLGGGSDDVPLGRLALLPADELLEALPPMRDTTGALPDAPVHDLVAAQAARTPDAVAVECGPRRLTYAQLMTRAGAIAGHLAGEGVRGGDLVGVAVPRGTDLVAALLGVHLAGAAYVPLDPEHPADRLAYVIADAGAKVVLTPEVLARVGAGPGTRAAALPGDPAYVIYTSGSTGQPKGVMVTHAALTNFLRSMHDRPGIPAGAAFPAVTTASFDIAALELFLPLVTGGRVVVSEAGEARDPERLAALLARISARCMQATPATWRLLLDSGWTPPAGFTALCGGERLPADLAARLCAAGVRLWDLYGPTETTVWSSVSTVEPSGARAFTAVANTTLYVLDERQEPVPAGTVGELYIGGAGVAVGYLGRCALTAGRFVPDPFGTVPGARLYRTGDLARRHPGGRIEILGRTDHQVKIRGFRVEPGEVETVLAAHDTVRAAVVHPVADAAGNLRLVGYVQPADPAQPPLTRALYLHCARLIPAYMIPAQIVVLDAFPTTPNGKLDRNALPVPAHSRTGPATRSPVEQVVAKVLAEVLDQPELGPDDDFFALGGDSLLAVRAVNRLRTEFGVDLPVSAFFAARTVTRLAARLGTAPPAVPPVRPVPRDGTLPMSAAQRRMWFLQQLDPADVAYLEPLAVPLPGPFDLDRAHAALTLLFERHEILRTGYADDGQVIAPPAPVRPAHEPGDPATVLAAELRVPFDLSAGPPVRVRLVGDTALLVLHHIATDDRTHEVLAEELVAAYLGRPLPPQPLQYADYASWEHARPAPDLTFWRDRLAGARAVSLPTDRRVDHLRAVLPDRRAGTVHFTVPAPVVARLHELGVEHEATQFVTLLAGFMAVLGRHSGHSDVTVGVPVSVRDRPELERVAGLLVNTVVMRADLGRAPTFAELLAAVRDQAVAAYPHADVPFDLVAGVHPEPLFSVMFVTHARTAVAPPFPRPDTPGAKFDLGCHVTDRADGGLDGRIEYTAALYDEPTVTRFAADYVDLLAVAGADPRHPTLPADTFAAGPPPTGEPVRIVSSDRPAVTGNGRTLTYAELNREANRLAHRLRALGAGPGRFVAVRLRTPDLVVALLGVLRSGAAYIPLDPAHPAARLRQALDDSGAVTAVVPSGTALPAGVTAVCLDDPSERALLRTLPGTIEDVATGDDLAYAVYTSGSTGRPKGAMVTRRGLAGYVRWAVATLPLGGPGAAGQPLHTSLAFDLALTALWPTLAAGAPLHLVPEGPGVEGLAAALDSTAFDVVKLTPTHLGLLDPAPVGALVIGGEELRGEHLAGWAPGTVVVNSYGPSETAVACCVHVTTAGQPGPGPVPIGRPLPGVRVHVLDDDLRPVPVGVPGELHVGGDGVGRGYLGDPRLTADRFRPDPWSGEPGARLYRTGDLARRLPDGTLLFLGRRDGQLKVRGHRVEPGEVESVLVAHPAVAAAAVVLDGTQLAAHLVPSDPGLDVAAVRRFAAERLPEHQVPTLWATLRELPLLRNGKLDRRALPPVAPSTVEDYEAPATPAERAIAEVWARLLGVRRVGRHDRFFDLGGQSLLATRVVAGLRDRLPVTVRDVFAAPTVASLAVLLGARARAQLESFYGEAAESAALDTAGPRPLSYAQQGLWIVDQLNPGGTEYLVLTALRLRGRLDVDALRRALSTVVARHEILRTRYEPGPDGVAVQVVDPPGPVPLPVTDADPRAVLTEELGTPIDLATGPVLRARLIRAAPDEHVLSLVVHHIATDGWSAGILAADLADAYAGVTTPVPSLQYGDFAIRQRRHLTGRHLQQLQGYWRQRLDGLDPTELPTDRPRPAVRDGRGDVLRFTVPADLVARLDALGRGHGATPFMTYLAGYLALLAHWTGRTDLAVGVPVSGRGSAFVDELIGYFVNSVVVRADLTGDPTFGELLGQVRDTAVDAYRHDELPFELLVQDLAPQRDLSRHPLFGLLFALREEGEERFRLRGLDVTAEPVPWRTAKFDLTLELTRRPDGALTGELEYATALFDRSTVERFARHYTRLLADAADRPHATVRRLRPLDPAEAAPSAGPLVPRGDAGLPELFAAQAARTPEAVAVSCPGAEVGYAELDRAANRLAHHLRAAGAGRDDIVAVCLPRGPALVTAVLGIQRAGAAYLPLDLAHPVERLAWTLTDAHVRLVLVDDPATSPLAAVTGGWRLLGLDPERDTIAARPGGAAPVATDPDGLAYVMYTSGSTGRPKGVGVPHRGIVNRVLWAVGRHGLGPGDRMLQKTSVTFDASVWELLGPLVWGGTVVLPPEGTERDPALMAAVLAERSVTVLQGVPSFFRALAEEPGLDRCTTLRLIFSAGEPLPPDLARALITRTGATLVNTYGPTECSIDVTAWQVSGEETGTVPIGHPLDNTRAAVLGPGGAPVPPGVPGELVVAGAGVGRGYLGRPG
ncbi:amino acid adenylation domain-containing protein [Dactylosporangium sp. NBC_01737]|uniref:non-ribosomal peptide synthetase n=1 Tax=Dactylosporangium sp. NBC_01737 TaxID=2975959 RepID=UPI002E0D62DA|nr:non-ribosomal peptide synthetase [Dactylosporangium sp. NBC_01737]WSG37057.1 amino acid adenylation domain-containing protein [Dactylosporangium sp. NBC_01737]